MSDATIQTPIFQSIHEIRKMSSDSSFAIEFQPEKEGQRRLLYVEPKQAKIIKKSVQAEVLPKETPDVSQLSQPSQPSQPSQQSKPKNTNTTTKLLQKVQIVKDTTSRLPDTYRILENGTDRGLLAIRSLDMSRKLRELFTRRESCMIDAEWYEPFQKYELKQLYFS
jgi:hypothetical protein